MKRLLFFVVLLTCVFARVSAQQPTKSAVGPSSEQSLQEAERAILNDLNDKLNALVEIEMAPK